MTAEYEAVRIDEAERSLSEKSETRYVDLTTVLGLTEMRARVWDVEAGNARKTYHRQERQEELYYVIDGPGRMEIGDETVDVPEGTALRVPPETPRRVINDTERDHVWLVVGAPPVADDGRSVPRDE